MKVKPKLPKGQRGIDILAIKWRVFIWKKGAKFNQPTPSDLTPSVTEHKLGLITGLKAAMVANF